MHETPGVMPGARKEKRHHHPLSCPHSWTLMLKPYIHITSLVQLHFFSKNREATKEDRKAKQRRLGKNNWLMQKDIPEQQQQQTDLCRCTSRWAPDVLLLYASQVFFCLINITSKQGGCWGPESPHLGYAFLLLLTILSYFSVRQPLLKSWVHRLGRARKKKCSPQISVFCFLKTESH